MEDISDMELLALHAARLGKGPSHALPSELYFDPATIRIVKPKPQKVDILI